MKTGKHEVRIGAIGWQGKGAKKPTWHYTEEKIKLCRHKGAVILPVHDGKPCKWCVVCGAFYMPKHKGHKAEWFLPTGQTIKFDLGDKK